MYKKLILIALMAFAGIQGFAADSSVAQQQVVEEIPQATLDYIFATAATVWDTHADVLAAEYQAGKLSVKPIGEDEYDLVWNRAGGTLILTVLDEAGF
jgi:4-amino-4-deoxy-L-arabinose transferase-like glycosyltransferase